jgi:hypothetical protein
MKYIKFQNGYLKWKELFQNVKNSSGFIQAKKQSLKGTVLQDVIAFTE